MEGNISTILLIMLLGNSFGLHVVGTTNIDLTQHQHVLFQFFQHKREHSPTAQTIILVWLSTAHVEVNLRGQEHVNLLVSQAIGILSDPLRSDVDLLPLYLHSLKVHECSDLKTLKTTKT